MGTPTGFLEYNRETAKVLPPKVRIANFKEFRTPLNKEKQKLQGARCMACGALSPSAARPRHSPHSPAANRSGG